MRIDADEKKYVWAKPVTVDVDPTSSTVELELDGTRYPMAWQGAAVVSGGKWSQEARTTVRFAGSTAPISGTDVRPAIGQHWGKVVVTFADGQIAATFADRIDVE